MPTLPPSIFNDVIGPVMRGPSSSHCAASVRIGRLARDLVGGVFDRVRVQYDPNGSLATTHESQGSDMGLFGGLMGWDPVDERLDTSHRQIREAGIDVDIAIEPIQATHPNTYKLCLGHGDAETRLTALSVGGGMIKVIEVDGFAVSLLGDYHVLLVQGAGEASPVQIWVEEHLQPDYMHLHEGIEEAWLLEAGTRRIPDGFRLDDLREQQPAWPRVAMLGAVLPVLSRSGMSVPFLSVEEMLRHGTPEESRLSDYALMYEGARSGLATPELLEMMSEIVTLLQDSIRRGQEGTEYADRILGFQSGRFREDWDAGRLLDGGLLNRMILYVTTLMEVKSSMGVIVAAPTAGSCAAMPGAVLAAAEELDAAPEDTARAFLSAGLIGVFTAVRSSFAAEVGGCQAETGAGAAMAAAALVELNGGNTPSSLAAASLALQNVLGLVCDPVANRVEAPCLGRNVSAAANALSSANMALAGFDPLIPLDEVLDAHREISESMPRELRCTALGGLSVTPSSKAIEQRLCHGCSSCGSG